MKIINDDNCGWLKTLPDRLKYQDIANDLNCEWIIIGAGYTGLSAARTLGNLYPNKKIILVDAQFAAEGASSRNSGYLVDTILNDGFTSNKEVRNYKKKTEIYNLGILAVKKFIKEYQVDCDWNEAGKYFASSEIKDKKILDNFSNTLNKLNFDNNFFFENDLKDKLGTNFYKVALYTKGGILINPAKLARAMIDTLPDNVELIENFQLLKWSSINGSIICYFKKNKIISKNIIFCTNGFLSSLGLKKNYNFPISLTASMTRKLDDNEFRNLGEPNEWGVLPVKAMGATIRMTKDRRILIRNTAELNNPFLMEKKKLEERKKIHLNGIKKRFPFLPNDIIEHTWSGIVCRSRNSSQLFEKIDKNIFIAGCYNGSGIGVGTLFGEQIALKATNNITDEINLIENRLKPSLLPPQPFLNLGIRTRLFFERFMAQKEI